MREDEIARFWSKVDQSTTDPDACWNWTGNKDSNGYGIFSIKVGNEPNRRRNLPAHRTAYELLVTLIPDGLTCDHLCRNRACVNPRHLEPVSNRENILRGTGPAAINARKASCKHGHPFSGDNLCVLPSGGRYCRACNREKMHRLRRAKSTGPRWTEAEKSKVASRRESQDIRGSITHCKNGHELSGDNLYVRPGGYKCCMQCRREALRRCYANKKSGRLPLSSGEGDR